MEINTSLNYDIHFQSNCVTGGDDHLYDRLKVSISKAIRIDIIVAFLMESGVRMLEEDLKEAVNRGAHLRILCGNYLNITQPQALYLLKSSLGDKVDLRFYDVAKTSFHPKAYLFEHAAQGEIYIGSSNVSRSALTKGIEWNYRIDSLHSQQDYDHFKSTFEDLFLNHSIIIDDVEIRKYSKNWRRPKVYDDLEKWGETEPDSNVIQYPRPQGPQIEALYELRQTRVEGWDKGIVVAATGVGKTYLAAFDSMNFKKVLFVAHREEILSQAERSFRCIRPNAATGYFSGDRKDTGQDIVFATVQTLGQKQYLTEGYFKEDEFDYIVIDEFHHAVAGNYSNVLEYFKPKFLLGLTATPERLDNQDVFALCDYNVVYEARLKEAINKGWLVPFRYYGVFDETDYSNLDFKNGRYDEKQLETILSIHRRANLILQNYQKYGSKRALGFCTSRKHACYMAEYFSERGIKAGVVVSGEVSNSSHVMDRKDAIRKLKTAEVNILFSVDIFNEGLDVPEVDMVMFLRPTESPTVFLQQLGRGLRKNGNKKYVNVLDFIGNYKRANHIPYLLIGDGTSTGRPGSQRGLPEEEMYPENCLVNYDFQLVDLFTKMEDSQKSIFVRVVEEYHRIAEKLSARPTRLDMYTYMEENIYQVIRKRKDFNIFRDYLTFLDRIDETTAEEKELLGTAAHDFLIKMENTSMSKMYKMPILLAFYNQGNMKMEITEGDIYHSFEEFYSNASNAVDMQNDKSTANFKRWGKKEYVNLARRMPMYFLMQSAPEFFYLNNGKFCLNGSLESFKKRSEFINHLHDLISYRTRRFYRERIETKDY